MIQTLWIDDLEIGEGFCEAREGLSFLGGGGVVEDFLAGRADRGGVEGMA